MQQVGFLVETLFVSTQNPNQKNGKSCEFLGHKIGSVGTLTTGYMPNCSVYDFQKKIFILHSFQKSDTCFSAGDWTLVSFGVALVAIDLVIVTLESSLLPIKQFP